ncbi:MAG: hypothetical protein U0Q12_15775 [Vicinamibacterales bacterium]
MTAAIMLLSLWSVSPQGPGGGTLQGRIEVPDGLPGPRRRPETRELGGSPVTPTGDRRRTVVSLDLPDTYAPAPPAGHATMDQRNETFVPRVLAITVGTVVDFPNSDPTFHNVFSLSRARRFDLGRYPAGQSKSVKFDRPGVVRVFCDIHSHMSAFILVFSHRYFALADADGSFRIDNVPAGAYTVNVWNDVLPAQQHKVIVPPRGATELRVTLTRDRTG